MSFKLISEMLCSLRVRNKNNNISVINVQLQDIFYLWVDGVQLIAEVWKLTWLGELVWILYRVLVNGPADNTSLPAPCEPS